MPNDYFVLVIPCGDHQSHEIRFQDTDEILQWLDSEWPQYQNWLRDAYAIDDPIQDDMLSIDYVSSDGSRRGDSIIVLNPDTGELETV